MIEEQTRVQKVKLFLNEMKESVEDGRFQKLNLGHYKGETEGLKKILIRRVELKSGMKFQATHRYKSMDEVQNLAQSELFHFLEKELCKSFHIATLFTKSGDTILENIHNKKLVLRRTLPAVTGKISTDHDHKKSRYIDAGSEFLIALGVTSKKGLVYDQMQDKFKQINQFIHLLSPSIEKLDKAHNHKVVDMGSGKGYLTFALYAYLQQKGIKAIVNGVEMRQDLVKKCNDVADRLGYDTLQFFNGTIDGFKSDGVDILVALHACNTATDDAIYSGIVKQSKLIVTAPCCHKQIRREISKSGKKNQLSFVTRHGIYLERQAEMITDALRILAMEYAGYSVKAVEFISDQHTPKNVMLIAEQVDRTDTDRMEIKKKIMESMQYFGIDHHHLIDRMELNETV